MSTTYTAPTRAGKTPAWDRPVRLTALHRAHLAHGATIVERASWLLPSGYGDPAAEAAAVHEAVGLLDIGEGGKIDLKSGDLDAALAAAYPALSAVRIESVARSGETAVWRLTAGQALIVTAPGAEGATLDALGAATAGLACTHACDLTGALAGLRLHGPKAAAVLERVTSLDLAPDRFPDGALAQCGLARAHAIVARRDAAGILGYDMYVDRDLGAYLWEVLLEQGAPLGLKPVGRDNAAASG